MSRMLRREASGFAHCVDDPAQPRCRQERGAQCDTRPDRGLTRGGAHRRGTPKPQARRTLRLCDDGKAFAGIRVRVATRPAGPRRSEGGGAAFGAALRSARGSQETPRRTQSMVCSRRKPPEFASRDPTASESRGRRCRYWQIWLHGLVITSAIPRAVRFSVSPPRIARTWGVGPVDFGYRPPVAGCGLDQRSSTASMRSTKRAPGAAKLLTTAPTPLNLTSPIKEAPNSIQTFLRASRSCAPPAQSKDRWCRWPAARLRTASAAPPGSANAFHGGAVDRRCSADGGAEQGALPSSRRRRPRHQGRLRDCDAPAFHDACRLSHADGPTNACPWDSSP